MSVFKSIFNLPKQIRAKIVKLSILSFLNSITEMIGFSLYIPIIILLFYKQGDSKRAIIDKIALNFGITNPLEIIISLGAALLIISVLKIAIQIKINSKINKNHYETYNWAVKYKLEQTLSNGLQYIKDNTTATLTHNICFATYTFTFGYLKPLVQLISDIFTIIAITAIAASINPLSALIVMLIFIPAITIYLLLYKDRLSKLGQKENSSRKNQMRIVNEALRGYAEIKVNNYLPIITERLDAELEEHKQIKRETDNRRELFTRPTEALVLISIIVIVALASIPTLKANFTPLFLGVLAAAVLKLLPTIKSALSASATMKNSHHAVEIIYNDNFSSTNEESPSIIKSNDSKASSVKLDASLIEVKSVKFAFRDSAIILNNINLLINTGDIIGIKGKSGAGKTTLIHLLLGLIKPTEGDVLISGELLDDSSISAWHKRVAYVSQDTFMLNSPILENIQMNNPFDKNKLDQIIEMTALDKFIQSLPKKEYSLPGEAGVKLSGGLKQRVALARALYKEADLIILDEATSSLDAQTEAEVLNTLKFIKEKNKNLTIIIVSHREAPITLCNKIYEI